MYVQLSSRLLNLEDILKIGYGDRFIFYDFNEPTKLHESLRNNFDYILIDPPFLNEECLNKFLDTVEFLSKGETRLVILSGTLSLPCHKRLITYILFDFQD